MITWFSYDFGPTSTNTLSLFPSHAEPQFLIRPGQHTPNMTMDVPVVVELNDCSTLPFIFSFDAAVSPNWSRTISKSFHSRYYLAFLVGSKRDGASSMALPRVSRGMLT
ncbi:hypothetical protein PM082_008313 [Marasmius tenuissimus]|nr:hypothetical protein PM082_008313 [Marasmius tenuissimus]